MKRTIQLIQLLHAMMLCSPELYKPNPNDTKSQRYLKNKFNAVLKTITPFMTLLERNMESELIEGLYDEQHDTHVLLNSVLDMSPEQRIEVIKAFKISGILK